ncbi:MAG TPA: PhoH family protein [Pseudomonadaceae bacterium]|nr:PhoH family protein [Pseudomonadaceae bacterium]
MNSEPSSLRLELQPDNPQRLANLCGRLNEHIRLLEERLGLRISSRGNAFELEGSATAVQRGNWVLKSLYLLTASETNLTPDMVHLALAEAANRVSAPTGESTVASDLEDNLENPVESPLEAPLGSPLENTVSDASEADWLVLRTPKLSVRPRSPHQNQYLRAIVKHDINFGIGPAGTGKTWLAVAAAVEALTNERVARILLVRPAVEAGEKLGFLPGDLTQKVDPYLRPLYDALYEMLGFERVAKLIERQLIEIAPLAFMRGRTLNNSFIILDESQNTTASQMKMFLTRIGFGSTAVITGDHTQIDLPKGTRSGLVQATRILRKVEGVSFTWFNSGDVVRHPIVQRIVDAYEEHDRHSVAALQTGDIERQHERDS